MFDTALRAPHGFNPAAAASVLPWHRERTELILAGVPARDVDARLARQVEAGRLRLPEVGAMACMMSPGRGPDFGAWRPHVMVYLPHRSNRDWGIPGFTHDFPFIAEGGTPWAVAVMPMRVNADGTVAPEQVAGRHQDPGGRRAPGRRSAPGAPRILASHPALDARRRRAARPLRLSRRRSRAHTMQPCRP